MKWSHEKRSRKSPEQGQHYEHKPHFDYEVECIDNEHETQIARSPGKVGPECGKRVHVQKPLRVLFVSRIIRSLILGVKGSREFFFGSARGDIRGLAPPPWLGIERTSVSKMLSKYQGCQAPGTECWKKLLGWSKTSLRSSTSPGVLYTIVIKKLCSLCSVYCQYRCLSSVDSPSTSLGDQSRVSTHREGVLNGNVVLPCFVSPAYLKWFEWIQISPDLCLEIWILIFILNLVSNSIVVMKSRFWVSCKFHKSNPPSVTLPH